MDLEEKKYQVVDKIKHMNATVIYPFKRVLFITTTCCFFLVNSSAQETVYHPTDVSKPAYFDISPRLTDMKFIAPAKKKSDLIEVPNKIGKKEFNKLSSKPFLLPEDPVWQKQDGPLSNSNAAPILNFEGMGNLSGVYPPDTQGDISLDYFVQVVNLNFAVYSKTGSLLFGPAALSTIWEGIPYPWNGTNNGDPIVLYDQAANRWIISQFSLPGGNYAELVAISQTPDPTGPWYRYVFLFGNKMPDYPKFGIWPDAYYLSVNQFVGGYAWGGVGACALERSRMLDGDPNARMVYIDLGSSSNPTSMLPSDWDGSITPLPEEPNYFAYFSDWESPSDDYLRIWQFHVDWINTANSSFSYLSTQVTAPFKSTLCYTGACIPQPGTNIQLDPISDRLMYRLQYRNFGSYQSMVTNHTVDVDVNGHAGIRWYELRNAGTGWSIYQQGTYAPDTNHRWVGSVAMNGSGDMALGYSVSNRSAVYPGIRYTGRRSFDPLGQMTISEQNVINGSGSQTGLASRWGDYSMMTVDPSDDNTFWYTTEYIQETGFASWKTRIASFAFSDNPYVITLPATAITLSASILNGTVNPHGIPTNYHFEWGTSISYGNSTTIASAGTGTMTVSVDAGITGLTAGTLYHFRLVAENSDGATLGNDMSFTAGAPVVYTTPAFGISNVSVLSGGNVTQEGGSPVFERGVCWSLNANPSVADNHTNDGSGPGIFVSSVTGLSSNTTYHIRAYATNSNFTAYGDDLLFNTQSLIFIPSVGTAVVTSVTTTTATSGGNVTYDGNTTITGRGVCWNTSPNPTLSNNHTNDGTGTGVFVSNLTNLTPGTRYYVRAYVTNSVGTSYGNQYSFITATVTYPCPETPTVSFEGKTYNTVLIGQQCWLKENLNVGIMVPGTTTQTNNGIIEKYCQNDLESNCDIYGGLYQWDEAMQYVTTEETPGICPTGWHLPSDEDWTMLTDHLGGLIVAGGKIKEQGFTHWAIPNQGATNSSGFTALAGGWWWNNGYGSPTFFSPPTFQARFWSSSTNIKTILSFPWDLYLNYGWNYARMLADDPGSNGKSVRCLKPSPNFPTVTTSEVTNITQSAVASGGVVTNDGGSSIISKGVCWSTNPIPTINDYLTVDGTGTGPFVSNMTGLTDGTYYYLRAYAINSSGIAYGNKVTFVTNFSSINCGNPIVYEGKTYNTIQIGDKCWLKENLNVGIRIDDSIDQTNNSIIEKYCYNNLESNCDDYGGIYQWDEAMQFVITEGAKGICPTGWHIPTLYQWRRAIDYLGGENVAGGKMKEAGLTHWAWPNTGATNSSGFTGLPAGGHSSYWNWNGIFIQTAFWSSTEWNNTGACSCYLETYNEEARAGGSSLKSSGYSVRCIKDSCTSFYDVGISIVASANPVYAGTSVTFSATPTNGGASPVYQWKVNGNDVGTSSPVYSYYPANNDHVTCVLTSSLLCARNNPTTSNLITMVVTGTPTTITVTGTATGTICYDATQTINVAGNGTSFTVQSGGSVTMIAGQNIIYLPTTTVQSGGSLWGYIAPTGPYCTNPAMPAIFTGNAEIQPIAQQSFFKIYPNPTTGKFKLEITGEPMAESVYFDIYGIWGERILTETLNGENNHEFSLSGQPSGVYFIRVISGDKAETVKIIKQ